MRIPIVLPKAQERLQVCILSGIAEMIRKDAKKHNTSVSKIIADCIYDQYYKRYLIRRELEIKRELERIEKLEQEENPRE